MGKVISIFLKYLTGFTKAQIIASLVSFPILVHWGIPLSCVSFLGNLIFTPFLTVFIILSTTVFFTELCAIPNGTLVTLLTTFTSYWDKLLHFGNKNWLVGISHNYSTLKFLIIVLVAIIILRFVFRIFSKILILGLVVAIGFSLMQHNISPPKVPDRISITEKKDKSISITDNGLFNKKASPEKFIRFELKPFLIKRYGTTSVEKLTLTKPSARSFKAAEEFCRTFTVKKVEIPYFKKKLSKYGWKKFFALKRKIKKNNIQLVRC